MPFNKSEVSALLSQCHRRCCICHRFCGVKIETYHIIPTNENGTDDIENAIPVCFECHAEIHSYNDKHPRGRKFQPEELRLHKEQWLRICVEHPESLIWAIRNADVGPLQALIDELEFNETVAEVTHPSMQTCRFQDQQFLRAIHEGLISLLHDTMRVGILEAYRVIGAANGAIESRLQQQEYFGETSNTAERLISEALPKIKVAREELLKFLCNEPGSEATLQGAKKKQ